MTTNKTKARENNIMLVFPTLSQYIVMKNYISTSQGYLIRQNFIGQNFRRTKYFVGQNFRHQAEISTLLSDFCLTFVLKHWTKFSTDKIFRRTKFSTPSRNFDNFVRFLPDFCIEISDKIFDAKSKFRQLCLTNFCPIRYNVILHN